MNKIDITARDLPDLWFQAVSSILDNGRRFVVDRGSYAGQTRLEFDYFTGFVKYPGTDPMLPDIPAACGIPNPVEYEYVFGGKGYDRSYIEYIMSDRKEPGELYTYGERLVKTEPIPQELGSHFWSFRDSEKFLLWEETIEWDTYGGYKRNRFYYLNQIEFVIALYKHHGHRDNQLVLQVARPSDLALSDPPCLRHIDTRIQDNRLIFFVYFRSWDLWGGLPANLAGIETLKQYMAMSIGVENGPMLVESKGLHLYGYAEDLAKMRCMR